MNDEEFVPTWPSLPKDRRTRLLLAEMVCVVLIGRQMTANWLGLDTSLSTFLQVALPKLGLILLLLYILWNSGDPLRHFGLKSLGWWRSVEAFGLCFVGEAAVVIWSLRQAPEAASTVEGNLSGSWLLLVSLGTVLYCFGVVLAFVGCLVPRFRELGLPKWAAAGLSAGVLGLMTVLYRPDLAVTETLSILPASLCFLRWRSIYPMVAAGVAANLLGIVLVNR